MWTRYVAKPSSEDALVDGLSWPMHRWNFSFKPFQTTIFHRSSIDRKSYTYLTLITISSPYFQTSSPRNNPPANSNSIHFPSPGRHLQRMLDEFFFFLAFLGVFWIQIIWTSNFGFVLNFSFSDHPISGLSPRSCLVSRRPLARRRWKFNGKI